MTAAPLNYYSIVFISISNILFIMLFHCYVFIIIIFGGYDYSLLQSSEFRDFMTFINFCYFICHKSFNRGHKHGASSLRATIIIILITIKISLDEYFTKTENCICSSSAWVWGTLVFPASWIWSLLRLLCDSSLSTDWSCH